MVSETSRMMRMNSFVSVSLTSIPKLWIFLDGPPPPKRKLVSGGGAEMDRTS
jgi:hypothetical protein